jgi:hypothetical protein
LIASALSQAAHQGLRLLVTAALCLKEAKEVQSLEMIRLCGKDRSVKLFGLRQLPGSMQCHRAGHPGGEAVISVQFHGSIVHTMGSTAKLCGGSPRRKSSHICV